MYMCIYIYICRERERDTYIHLMLTVLDLVGTRHADRSRQNRRSAALHVSARTRHVELNCVPLISI